MSNRHIRYFISTAAAAAAPFVVAPFIGVQSPQSLYLPFTSLTTGTPLVLRTAVVQRPLTVTPFFGPNAQSKPLWLNQNTSAGQPLTLKVSLRPFVPAPHYPPPRFWWQPHDTSQRTPKPLYGDQIPPRINAPQFLVVPPPAVVDTSRGSYGNFYPFAPALPVGQASFVALPRLLWQPQDMSVGTPNVVRPDQIPPVINAPQFRVDAPYPVVDTSRGTPAELIPPLVVPLPPGSASFVAAPFLPWVPADTTKGSYGTFYPVVVATPPPGAASFVALPRLLWQPQDTSTSSYGNFYPFVVQTPPPGQTAFVALPRLLWQPLDTSLLAPKTTFGDATFPTFNPSQFMVERQPPVVDTSRSSYGMFYPFVAPTFPAGATSFVAAPRLLWQPQDMSQSSAVFYKGQIFLAPIGRLILQGYVPTFSQGSIFIAPVGQLILQGTAGSFVQSTPVAHVIDYEFYEKVQPRTWKEVIAPRLWKEAIPKRSWNVTNQGSTPPIGPKDPTEVIRIGMDFSAEAIFPNGTEYISAINNIAVTAIVGTDPAPSMVGVNFIGSNGFVYAFITGGLNGVTYEIKITVSTTGGRILVGNSQLSIVVA